MLNFKVAFVFSFALVFVVAQHDDHTAGHMNHEHHRVNVAVYYESLCPDSRKFFTQQLYPSLQGNLSNYVNLTLVPFGKTKVAFENDCRFAVETLSQASEPNLEPGSRDRLLYLNKTVRKFFDFQVGTLQYGEKTQKKYQMEFKTAEYEFNCHHGPKECEGNKIQACALKLIDQGKKTDGFGFNKVAVGFINCLMDKTERKGEDATFPTKDCAEINHVNNLNLIENCAGHTDGSNYLANLGTLTNAVANPLKGVPTIVFNQQFKADDNTLAQANFVKALCQYIQGDKPSECNGANNVKISLGFLLVVSIITKLFN